MELFLASSNKHKFHEMSILLKGFGVSLKRKRLELFEPDSASLEETAKFKAKQAFEKIKKPVIAEDTGVFFEAYRDFPGPLAKRVFLGIGFEGLTALVKNARNRKAFFKTVVCFHDGKKFKTFSGKMNGTLLSRAVSVHKDRLPYEKLFVPQGFTKALVDLSIDEKNRISHRATATRKLGKWLASKAKKGGK